VKLSEAVSEPSEAVAVATEALKLFLSRLEAVLKLSFS